MGEELATFLVNNNLTLEERFDLEHLLINNPILNYKRYNNYLLDILNKSKNNNPIFQIKEVEEIGRTNFNYPIRHFTAGIGNKHIVMNASTHGCEIITVSFVLELMNMIAESNPMFINILNEVTIHFIPLLNPEGFIVATSAIDYIFKDKTNDEKLKIMTEYMQNYRQDDRNVNEHPEIREQKLHRKTFESCTADCIGDEHKELRESIRNLINKYNLPQGVLGIWSSNGMGVDLNKNHPFNFDFYKKDRENNPYLNDRYNDIDRSTPGPIGYIGDSLESNDAIENKHFLKFIETLKNDIVGIFLYHSVGGLIYAEVNPELPRPEESINNTHVAASVYSFYTSYKVIEEVSIVAFNGYLRSKYNDAVVLLVELSRIPANPIGTFVNPYNYKYTIHTNCEAFVKTGEKISKLLK